jgi:hypothetical protein
MTLTLSEACRVGDDLKVNWKAVCPNTFHRALEIEIYQAKSISDDPMAAGRTVIANLRSDPKYYDNMTSEAAYAARSHARGGVTTCQAAVAAIVFLVFIVLVLAGVVP